MDRIRKALDLARLERSQPVAEPAQPGAAAAAPASVFAGLPDPIVYHRTRVFTPPAEVLEASRVMNPASTHTAAAAFRMLRTQVLQRMNANGWRSLAIFSPGAEDGKTTTAINLAASLANDRRHTVILVDFDFKRPTLAARFGLSPEFGSDDALAGNALVEDCLYHPDGFERLVLMPARDRLANSSEMLAGPRAREIVGELRARYPERIVLIDLPPVLGTDDALAFAPLIECGLVVAAEGRTRRNDLMRTIELLHKIPLVGTVLNRSSDAPSGY
jgi:Mrp family chromosome partitioning ATPase